MPESNTFEKPQGLPPATDTEFVNSVNLPAPRAQMGMTVGGMDGEESVAPLQLKWLQIAHPLSKFPVPVPHGALVLDKTSVLTTKAGDPLTIIIVNGRRYWKEWTKYNAASLPRIFNTHQEVLAAKGTTEWSDGPDGRRMAPTFGQAISLKLLIKQPAGIESSLFGIEMEGGVWAPAQFAADKTAYAPIDGEIRSAMMMALRGKSLLHGIFTLRVTEKSKNGNTWFVPVLKFSGATSEATRSLIGNVFSNVAPSVDAEGDDTLVPEPAPTPF